MIELMRAPHGSHLYGLNTPSSDMDFKGIFLPDIREILLERAPKNISNSTGNDKSKNTAEDIDIDLYSLRYFLSLCLQGETTCIDMIHTPDTLLEVTSPEWEFIRANRSKFYTKSMKAFLGYARKQAAKYGVKGSRMGCLEEVVKAIDGITVCEGEKLELARNILPINEYCKFTTKESKHGEHEYYDILGSYYQMTMPMSDFVEAINNKWNSYGERARLAKDNQGIDWKALSHALRAGYQLHDIFTKGDLVFPFEGERREFLLSVKKGERDFLGEVEPALESLISEVETLAERSTLPEKANGKFWDTFIIDVYKQRFGITL